MLLQKGPKLMFSETSDSHTHHFIVSEMAEVWTWERGWDQEIKPKAIDPLTKLLSGDGLSDRNVRDLFGPKDYVHVYTCCYTMSTQRNPSNFSEQLYQKHNETIVNYLKEKVVPALRGQHNDFLLKEFKKRWDSHKIMNDWMRKFFMYLDRYHIKHNSLPSLHESGIKLFKQHVYDTIKADVLRALLGVISREREGEVVDRTLIAGCVEVFEAMGGGADGRESYKEDLEAPLIAGTREYYARKSQEWIESDDTPSYLIKAERALEEEKDRVAAYLNRSTEDGMLKVIVEEVLEKHSITLLEREGSGCVVLLANDKEEDLSRMYRLLKRVPEEGKSEERGLTPMANIVQKYIEEQGIEIINKTAQGNAQLDEKAAKAGLNQSDAPSNYVQGLLSLHDKFLALVNQQFEASSIFHKALKRAFESVVNRNVFGGHIESAELMTSFCDRILKTGGMKVNDQEVEEYLEKVVTLFEYIKNKDVFQDAYRNTMSKRLINDRSSNEDWEKLMILKLKQKQGAPFTSRMEGMMTDLAVGADHNKQFAESVKDLPIKDFTTKVLTSGFWVTPESHEITLPEAMRKCTEVFKVWYLNKMPGRRLAWQHGLGSVTLKAKFANNKSYDIVLTTHQAIVLLAFSEPDVAGGDGKGLNLAALHERLRLPVDDLKPILHSLSCGKFKVLSKSVASKKITEEDYFTVNASFTCPQRVIRITMPSLERAHNPERVQQDRLLVIDAAIVRIMKSRKVLSHQDLIVETQQQIKLFTAEMKQIKQQIAALIEKEYLERDPNDWKLYRYLA